MKTYSVVLTNKADRDLGDIFEYIAVVLSAPKAVSDTVSRLYNSMRSLSSSPFRYPLARDGYLSKQGFRIIVVNNYIVFYVVDESAHQVIIHRVLYGKRNYMQLLKNEDL